MEKLTSFLKVPPRSNPTPLDWEAGKCSLWLGRCLPETTLRYSLFSFSFLTFYFVLGSDSKASACNVGDLGSTPGLRISPGRGHGNPLQYSCLENPHRQRSLVGYIPWGHRVGCDWATNHSTYILAMAESCTPKFVCWGSNTHMTLFGHLCSLTLFRSHLLLFASLCFSNTSLLGLQVKYTHISLSHSTHTHTHQERPLEDTRIRQLFSRQEILTRIQPYWHPDLRLPASRTMKKLILLV